VFVRTICKDTSGPRLSLFVWPTVEADGASATLRDAGFRDMLCGLIGRAVPDARATAEHGIVIDSDADRVIVRPARDDVSGPEIAMLQLDDEGLRWNIWRPGEGVFTHDVHRR
jgi:hypothetical protein